MLEGRRYAHRLEPAHGRCCQPRDLLQQVKNFCTYHGTERVLISLEDLAPNRVMVEFNKRYGRDVPVAKVFSQHEGYRALVTYSDDFTLMSPFGGPPPIAARTDPVHDEMLRLDPPRKHYQWYYSTRAAERDMLAGVLNVEDRLVREIMTPRRRLTTVAAHEIAATSADLEPTKMIAKGSPRSGEVYPYLQPTFEIAFDRDRKPPPTATSQPRVRRGPLRPGPGL